MASLRLSEAKAKKLLGQNYKPKAREHKAKQTKQDSPGEDALKLHLSVHKIDFKTQFRFNPSRRWKADFRLLDTMILVEVEGGIWTKGRHTRGTGFENDTEKYNWATANGWQVLRFSTGQVLSGKAIKNILEILKK